MCSNAEDLDEFEGSGSSQRMVKLSSPQAGILEKGGVCKKCNGEVDTLYQLNFRAAECRECFLAYVRHKFRATLGSSKLMRREEKVLLVFDGTPEAIMMVDMMHYALTQNTYKRLHCIAKILYIDESNLLEENNKKTKQGMQDIQAFLKNYKIFECYFVPINIDRDETINIRSIDKLSEVEDSLLKPKDFHLASIKSLTSRQDYLYEHRKRIIMSAAEQLNCKYAFLPDTSVKLAARLMSSIALGRGGSAASDVSLLDHRGASLNGVTLVRPLKDVNTIEVQLYLHAQQLEEQQRVLTQSAYGSDLGAHTSLQNLTELFMKNLHNNFSSTVSTVYRTGDKIATNDDSIERKINNLAIDYDHKLPADKCNLCLSQLDFFNSNTLLAIEFSRLTSEIGRSLNENNFESKNAYENVLGRGKSKQWSRLCHACRNIHRDMQDNNMIL